MDKITVVQLRFFYNFVFAFLILVSVFQFQVLSSETEEIRIITTNDLHSYLRPLYNRNLDEIKPWGSKPRDGNYLQKASLEGKLGGMAYVATVIKRLRSEKKGKTLLLDAGDTWHGAGISLFDKGVSMVKIMNAIGYDAMAPGNWEFMYPKDHILDLIEKSRFPVIAYNLMDIEWDEPVLAQYILRKVGKLNIAIVGMTYPWTALTTARGGSARDFKFGIRENEAQDLLEEIKENENPDLIVFVSHGGFGLDQKFARRVDGIDVYLSGHTHDEIFDPVVWNKAIVFQGGAHGKYIARLDLAVRDKKVIDFDYQLIKVTQNRITPDPEIEKLVDEAYFPYQEILNREIGETNTMLNRRDFWQSTMGNMLTDTLRKIQKTDISFFPAWRYGATLLPGKITAEDIYNIVPTEGHIFTYSIRGKELKSLIENILGSVISKDPYARVGGDMIRFSGMELECNLSKKSGERIVSMIVGGVQLSKEKLYTVSSVHTGFQNNPLFGATIIKDTGKVFVEELIAYISKNSPISSKLDDRIKLHATNMN